MGPLPPNRFFLQAPRSDGDNEQFILVIMKYGLRHIEPWKKPLLLSPQKNQMITLEQVVTRTLFNASNLNLKKYSRLFRVSWFSRNIKNSFRRNVVKHFKLYNCCYKQCFCISLRCSRYRTLIASGQGAGSPPSSAIHNLFIWRNIKKMFMRKLFSVSGSTIFVINNFTASLTDFEISNITYNDRVESVQIMRFSELPQLRKYKKGSVRESCSEFQAL